MVDVKCVFILMYSIYYSPRMIAFGSFFYHSQQIRTSTRGSIKAHFISILHEKHPNILIVSVLIMGHLQ